MLASAKRHGRLSADDRNGAEPRWSVAGTSSDHALNAHRRCPNPEAICQVVLASLARCTPVSITDDLGQALAGRRFTIRFRSKSREWQA
jgi:hypothetical protein